MRSIVFSLAAAVASAPLAGAQQFPAAPPAPLPVRPAQFPPFQRATLPNGLQLIVVSNPRHPLISMSMAFPAGAAHDPAGKSGLSEMVASLITKGAGPRDAEAVAEAIEGAGGSFVASAGADFLTVNVGVLTENATLGMGLLADAVMRPRFDSSEVELFRTQKLSSLQLDLSQPATIAAQAFARELYGAHPYGRSADARSVGSITRADLAAFHRARLVPGGALLVLAGDITLERARTLAGAAFSGWTGAAPAATSTAAPPTRTATEIVLVHRPGSVQSNILIGNLTWGPGDARHYAATLGNKILGGGADARLFQVLREQKGWTYGAYSSLTRYRGTGYFSATAEVRTEVTDSSITEMLAQLRRVRSEIAPESEFEAAKSSLVGRFPLQVETSAQVAAQVSTAQLLGLPADYVQTYRQRLAAVTAAGARDAVGAAIQPDRALIVVVGDGAKLHDRLRAIAPVRLVSADGATMAASDLVARSTASHLALDRLRARSDSFAIFVQGNPFGYQRSTLERAGDAWRYVEEVQLGPVMQQRTEVSFGADLSMRAVSQSGRAQGMEMKIDVAYAGGRAKGSATTPQPTGGVKTIDVDAEMPAGAVDDNALTALLPAFNWAPGAKFTLPVFQSGKGAAGSVTLSVAGEETATVPAGAIPAWKVELSGVDQPVVFWVEKAAPHRLVKVAIVGAPFEFRLVR